MANSTNLFCISGNLVRDPESIANDRGAKFSVAVNERFKATDTSEWEDRVHFFEVVQWGGGAGPVLKFLSKGSHVIVHGKLQQQRWEQDGQKRNKVVLVAAPGGIEFAAKSSAGNGIGRSDNEGGGDDFSGEDGDIPFLWRPVDEKPTSSYNPFE